MVSQFTVLVEDLTVEDMIVQIETDEPFRSEMPIATSGPVLIHKYVSVYELVPTDQLVETDKEVETEKRIGAVDQVRNDEQAEVGMPTMSAITFLPSWEQISSVSSLTGHDYILDMHNFDAYLPVSRSLGIGSQFLSALLDEEEEPTIENRAHIEKQLESDGSIGLFGDRE
jgi:hypothetical protein